MVKDSFATLRRTGKKLMVSGGNDYSFGSAEHIINAPMTTTDYYIIDRQIPLYQMILHGCVDYCGSPINFSSTDDETEQLLRLIEYGASTHYSFTWADATDMKYTGLNSLYATKFDTWYREAAEKYTAVNEALAPVSNALMTEHETLDNGVVRVTYSNGIRLYINYANEAMTADGLTVPAMGWCRGGEQ